MGEGALCKAVRIAMDDHGRVYRECVGMHFARNTLYLAAATMLSLFDFGKEKDEHGNEIETLAEFVDGLVACVFEREFFF
jgi:cytochrome P450